MDSPASPCRKDFFNKPMCKFEPRYDEIARDWDGNSKFEYSSLKELRSMLLTQVYVHDICVNCGRTIQRPERKEKA